MQAATLSVEQSSTKQSADATTYPHTITSGTGEKLTFLWLVRDRNVDRVEIENCIQPAAGPPMHVHYLQEEKLTVISGKMGYQVTGEPERFAEEGESVKFGPGIGHRFWNAGTNELRCVGYSQPTHNFEYILTAFFASMRANKGRPGLFDIAFLLTRYKSEIGMLEIPSAVQKFIFPVLVVTGRLLGLYAKFNDAPTPTRR